MKTLFLCATLALTTVSFAQVENTDTLKETTVTKTTVKSSLGEDVSIKKQERIAKQKLALEQDGTTNQTVNRKPVVVETSTTFVYDGEDYIIEPDPKGFLITIVKDGNESDYGKIRKMSRPNAYLLVTETGNAFGYFNAKGDFVVESYDPVNDVIVVDSFAISEDDLKQ